MHTFIYFLYENETLIVIQNKDIFTIVQEFLSNHNIDLIFQVLHSLILLSFLSFFLSNIYLHFSLTNVTIVIVISYIYILLEEFEDTKGVIRIRISKNRQHNGQKKINKRTNNDLQNIHIKLKIE